MHSCTDGFFSWHWTFMFKKFCSLRGKRAGSSVTCFAECLKLQVSVSEYRVSEAAAKKWTVAWARPKKQDCGFCQGKMEGRKYVRRIFLCKAVCLSWFAQGGKWWAPTYPVAEWLRHEFASLFRSVVWWGVDPRHLSVAAGGFQILMRNLQMK